MRETRVEGLFKSGAELDDVSARFVVESAVGKHEVEVAKAVLHSRVTTIFQLRSDRSQIHRLLHDFEIILQSIITKEALLKLMLHLKLIQDVGDNYAHG